MDKKEEKDISSESKKDIHTNVYKLVTEDAEFVMNIRKIKNPGELLEKFYLLREDQTLTSAEKNQLVKKIMIDYMG